MIEVHSLIHYKLSNMAVKLKLNYKISIPNKFIVDDKEILLSDIKSDFPNDNFYPQIKLLEPNDEKTKYNSINFRLDPSSLLKGNMTLNFENDKAIVDLNCEIKISPKPQYKDMVLDKSSKWCFGSIYINNSLSPLEFDITHDGENGEILSGGLLEEFSYEHRRLGTVNERLLLIEVEII
tara:strand:+ start:813 stop:1352 length:540 start_codon:yes stop_codon:yes gene_type:complete